MHQAVALRRKRVLIGLKGPIVPPAQPLCILPAQPQGALALIGPLLLLHLQHGEIRPGAVSPQADLPPQLQSVDLILEVLVVRGVKIQGADPVSLGAIVGIGVHDRLEMTAQHGAVCNIDRVFFLLPQNFVHCTLPDR